MIKALKHGLLVTTQTCLLAQRTINTTSLRAFSVAVTERPTLKTKLKTGPENPGSGLMACERSSSIVIFENAWRVTAETNAGSSSDFLVLRS